MKIYKILRINAKIAKNDKSIIKIEKDNRKVDKKKGKIMNKYKNGKQITNRIDKKK